MQNYLVIANQTAPGPALRKAVKDLMRGHSATFTLVVPATHPKDHLTWTEGNARELARARLLEALDGFRRANAKVCGWVGDEDPYLAACDALNGQEFDAVVLSTFGPSVSRWLRMDVASRIQRQFGVPVHLVVDERVPISKTG